MPKTEDEKLHIVRTEVAQAGYPYHEVVSFPGLLEGYRCVDFIIGVGDLQAFVSDCRKYLYRGDSAHHEVIDRPPWREKGWGRYFTYDLLGGLDLGHFLVEEVLGLAEGQTNLSFETDNEELFVGANNVETPTDFVVPVTAQVKGRIRLRPYPDFIIDVLADYEQGFLDGVFKHSTSLALLGCYLTPDQVAYSHPQASCWPKPEDLEKLRLKTSPPTTHTERAKSFHFPGYTTKVINLQQLKD